MTAAKPKPPYAVTTLAGGPATIIRICEDLRSRNDDGYLPHVGGILAKIKGTGSLPTPPDCKGTTCSPFTATVIGLAFDPKYPRDDLGGDPYVPMFNGGADPIPFAKFYNRHQSNDAAVASVVEYGLGTEIDATELRRGDLVQISWQNKMGHVVFCWDVHLDDAGKVDAIQVIGSNGPYPGVSIHGCRDKRWLTGDNAKVKDEVVDVAGKDGKTTKHHKFSLESHGTYKKAKSAIFVDDDEIVKTGEWFGIPGVAKGSVKIETFRARPGKIVYAGSNPWAVGSLRCARFKYDDPPPAPYCMKNGPPPPPPAPGHTDAQAVTVKGTQIQGDPAAPRKVPAAPVKQEKDRSLDWQHYVEQGLQAMYAAMWLATDPGSADDVNDPKTQAALKEFQTTFQLDVDGKIGPQTLGEMKRQLPACQSEHQAQAMLKQLFEGKKLQSDPGPPDGKNGPNTRAALAEFQAASGLPVTKVADVATQQKLAAAIAAAQPTADAPGLSPELHHLYWVGNQVDAGGTARLRLHAQDLKSCETCAVYLQDDVVGKEIEAAVQLTVDDVESEAVVPIPFAVGANVQARVVTLSAGEIRTTAPLRVSGGTETASWRQYVDADAVPDDVIAAIQRNRARYPAKTLPAATGKWAGQYHYDYQPPGSHAKWAKDYFQKKVDAATSAADKHVAQAFVLMLRNEGLPASMQTYDDQIVTWGVGLGGKGDGVYAFNELNKDAGMKKLLDDLGVNYDGGDYHVVDVVAKKVVSSAAGKKGNDARHVVALEAWRRQSDLLSAVIGISEDAATREAVALSQWQVYLSNSTKWGGQDKVYSLALYFMITHMNHWLPAVARAGLNVEGSFTAVGGGNPSTDTDTKIAPLLARGFIAAAKGWCDRNKRPRMYDDVHTRTKTHLWAQFRQDAKKEGFDPGDLSYEG